MISKRKKIFIASFLTIMGFNGIFVVFFPINDIKFSKVHIATQQKAYLDYNEYYPAHFQPAYTYHSIQWSFSSVNGSKITVLAMDYANFHYFDINVSSVNYYILSDGNRISDTGIFNIPYDNYWVVVFLNKDPTITISSLIITNTELVIDPFLFITLPIILITIVIISFLIISFYFKKRKQENKTGSIFCFFLMFLFIYVYISIYLIPNLRLLL
jgi:hypothetical protein